MLECCSRRRFYTHPFACGLLLDVQSSRVVDIETEQKRKEAVASHDRRLLTACSLN